MKYFWRALSGNLPSVVLLIRLLERFTCPWTSHLLDDFAWLWLLSSPREGLPKEIPPDVCTSFVSAQTKKQWYGVVNRAAARARSFHRVGNDAHSFPRTFAERVLVAGIVFDRRSTQSVSPLQSKCEFCEYTHVTYQGICRHLVSAHQVFAEQDLFISDKFCRGCMEDFPTRNHALRHVAAFKRCSARIRAHYLPLPHVVALGDQKGARDYFAAYPEDPWAFASYSCSARQEAFSVCSARTLSLTGQCASSQYRES